MIITIARQCGCGALGVGQLLATHYGIPCYTRRNLMEMASARGLASEMSDFFEERPVDYFLFSLSDHEGGPTAATSRPIRALEAMVGGESCVIIGRCGNHIFRHRQDLVSVFLGGDKQARVASIARDEGLAPAAALDFVDNTDECRAAYHRYYTGLTWGNAADYDICLDTIRLGAEATAAIIEQYAGALK